MASEVIAAKMVAPYFGQSIYVWAAMLGATLGGLAVGYYLGGKISSLYRLSISLTLILFAVSLYLFFWNMYGHYCFHIFEGFSLKIAISSSLIAILSPLMVLFGMISPIIIACLHRTGITGDRAISNVYTTNTFAGILGAIMFNLFIVFNYGIRDAISILSAIMFLAGMLSVGVKGLKPKPLCLFLTLIIFLSGCGNDTSHSIAVKYSGQKENQIISVKEYNPSSKDVLVSHSLATKTYFDDLEPDRVYVLKVKEWEYPFYYSGNNITIELDEKNLVSPKVKGDKDSEKFNSELLKFQKLKQDYEKKSGIVSTYIRNGGEFGADDEGRAYERQADEAEREMEIHLKNTIKTLPAIPALFFALQLHQKYEYNFLATFRQQLSPKVKSTTIGTYFYNYVEYMNYSLVGSKITLPPAKFLNGDKLSSSKNDNPYTWLFYFSSFCHAANEEYIQISALLDSLATYKVTPVFVSLDYNKQATIQFAEAHQIPLNLIICDELAFDTPLFDNMDVLPSNIILDKNNKIVNLNIKKEDWYAALKALPI